MTEKQEENLLFSWWKNIGIGKKLILIGLVSCWLRYLATIVLLFEMESPGKNNLKCKICEKIFSTRLNRFILSKIYFCKDHLSWMGIIYNRTSVPNNLS